MMLWTPLPFARNSLFARKGKASAPSRFAVALLATATLAVANGEAQAAELKPVTLGLTVAAMNSSLCMFPVGVHMGYFAKEGLAVTLQMTPGSSQAVQLVMSGRLDAAVATPEPIFKGIYNGGDLLMTYDVVRAPTGSIAVLDDSPIKALQDLRGKKLGAQSLASGNILLTNAILAKLGMTPAKDVTYLPIGVGAQARQAVESKQVDALVLFDAQYAQLENAGLKLRYFYGEGQEKLFGAQLVMKRTTAEKQPDIAKGLGRAIAKATLFANTNPEACVRIMWKDYPSSRPAPDKEAARLAGDLLVLKKRLTLLVTKAQAEHGWGYYDKGDIDAWNEFAVQGNIIPKKFDDVSRLYTNAFLKAYNDFNADEIKAAATSWKE
jgi:NitT/TauT family transport system substrate-binding protein